MLLFIKFLHNDTKTHSKFNRFTQVSIVHYESLD
jgi:hypothetical protein